MWNHLKQWWIGHAAWVSGVVYAVAPQVREYVCSHPKLTGTGLATFVLTALLKASPLAKAPE